MAKTEAKEKAKPLFSRRLDIGMFNIVDETQDGGHPKIAAMMGKRRPIATVEVSDGHLADISVWDGISKEPSFTVKVDLAENPKFDGRAETREDVEDEFLTDFLKETEHGIFKLFFVRLGAPGDVGIESFLKFCDITFVEFRRYYDKKEQKFDCFKVGVCDVENPDSRELLYEVEWPIEKKTK